MSVKSDDLTVLPIVFEEDKGTSPTSSFSANRYLCESCQKTYKTQNSLRCHVQSVHSIKPHMCQICLRRFKKKSVSEQHAWIHTDKRQFNCKKCDKSFVYSDCYKLHLKNHHKKPTPIVCKICFKKFTRKVSLNKHIRDIHLQKTIVCCPVCKKKFTQKRFKLHSKICKFVYECGTCKLLFKNSEVWRYHEKERKCDFCDVRFVCLTQIKDHVGSVHKCVKKFMCDICKVTFLKTARFSSHMKTKHGVNDPFENEETTEKTLVCEFCLKRFVEKDIDSHMLGHRDEKRPFKCPFCGKTFDRKDSFQRHVCGHTSRVTCENCRESFAGSSALTDHRYYCLQNLKKAEVDSITCEFCFEKFPTTAELDEHIQSHTKEENPYRCHFCKKTFSGKKSLIMHVKLHIANKPHACKKCEKRFDIKSQLTWHMRFCVKNN